MLRIKHRKKAIFDSDGIDDFIKDLMRIVLSTKRKRETQQGREVFRNNHVCMIDSSTCTDEEFLKQACQACVGFFFSAIGIVRVFQEVLKEYR
jgi:hypothetical protein